MKYIYDFERCTGPEGLSRVLDAINSCGYVVEAMTQDGDVYTVVFGRAADG